MDSAVLRGNQKAQTQQSAAWVRPPREQKPRNARPRALHSFPKLLRSTPFQSALLDEGV